MDIYTVPNVKLIATGKQPHKHRETSSVLCDHLKGWDKGVRGRCKREGIWGYMYTYS